MEATPKIDRALIAASQKAKADLSKVIYSARNWSSSLPQKAGKEIKNIKERTVKRESLINQFGILSHSWEMVKLLNARLLTFDRSRGFRLGSISNRGVDFSILTLPFRHRSSFSFW